MEESMQQLGLSQKESGLYLFLLEQEALPASAVATGIKESRTNTYMLLERLVEQGLVITNDKGVRTFAAAPPSKLKNLLLLQQQKLKQGQAALNTLLPQLQSTYRLSQHKPGVTYFEGDEGYKLFQEDSLRLKQPVNIFASNIKPSGKAQEALLKVSRQRAKQGIPARMIFHEDARNWLDEAEFASRGYEIRYWGTLPLEGEIAIYGQKVGITSYEEALITTVITNEIIADTFNILFEQIWAVAESA